MKHLFMSVLIAATCVFAAEPKPAKPAKRDYMAELKSGDEKVRAEAALLLKSNPKAVSALLGVLKSDPSDEVRLWAAFALGEIGDKAAAPALVEWLKSTPEAASRTYYVAGEKGKKPGDIVRRNVCWALGEIGDPRALEVLLEQARAGKDWEVRYYSVLSLGKSGHPRALPVLKDVAKSDPYRREWEKTFIVREQAKKAIAMIEGKSKGR